MDTAVFLTMILLHLAFALALAFFVLYFAFRSENGWLKNLGLFTGGLLVFLTIITTVASLIFAVKKPYFFRPPHLPYQHHHEENYRGAEKKGMPIMREDEENKIKEEREEKEHKTGAACPVNP